MSAHDMPEAMRAQFLAAFTAQFGVGAGTAAANPDAFAMLDAAAWAWQASRQALLKEQDREQEEFIAHLADFEQEDTFQ